MLRFQTVLAVAVMLALAGCSGGGTAGDGDSGGIDASGADLVLSDIASGELPAEVYSEIIGIDYGPADTGGNVDSQVPDGGDIGSTDLAQTDLPDHDPDGEDPDISDSGPDTDAGRPGDFEYPCDDDDECDSGFCVQTEDGRVCSRECAADCPDGWTCSSVQGSDGTPVFRCIPDTNGLCRPCSVDTDCRAGAYPMPGLRCTTFGDLVGSFCLPPCVRPEDCPGGTTCTEPPLGLVGTSKVCMPESGECSCSSLSIELGASSVCQRFTTGLLWGCPGERRCDDDGLSLCDARAPSNETCSGIDEDCNGLTDEDNAIGCTRYYLDIDGDGYGVDSDWKCLCAPRGRYTALVGGDCDDRNPLVHPGAREICNGIDDDCNGLTDEEGSTGCRNYFVDADGDGFGRNAGARCLCWPSAPHTATQGGDCDDDDALAFPGARERCNGKDDNCDGRTDEDNAVGCQTYYLDDDGDGYGITSASQCKCAPNGRFRATKVGDCNDADPQVYPGATEVCNGKDDDCDGIPDPEGANGCILYYRDMDGDGFGVTGDARCLCMPGPVYRALSPGDCDDENPVVNPGAQEICNGLDDNCNGLVDEEGSVGCSLYFMDQDGDGYGSDIGAKCLCGSTASHRVQIGGDCDDTDPQVHPGAQEVCGNLVDDNCNGLTDEPGCVGCSLWFRDMDGDGYGVTSDSLCLDGPDPVAGYTAPRGGDCDDNDPAVNPGAIEICNGKDDNCDGVIDGDGTFGCMVYFFDFDNDGYGVSGNARCLCAPTGRYRALADGDCNDQDRNVNPGMTEVCNGKDDNCNGLVDEDGAVGCGLFYLDDDGDGYGRDDAARCLCGPTGRYTATVGGDCNDNDTSIRPGATEKCNGRDDNCDGRIDEPGALGCVAYYRDADGDGYGLASDGLCLCAPEGLHRSPFPGDCNDDDPLVYPGAREVCDGKDNDCNGVVDDELAEGCVFHFIDRDGDGVGDSATGKCLCGPVDPWLTTVGGDCNDNDPTVGAGAPEVCDGKDNNCNGLTDEDGAIGCVLRFMDRDKDGYGVTDISRCMCGESPDYSALIGGDCNDSDPTVNPAAVERCNGRDDNCDGRIDEPGATGCTTFYRDDDRDMFGQSDDTSCLCMAAAPYDAIRGGDCDDANNLVFPGAPEVCNNQDDDCDGIIDNPNAAGCTVYYRDRDRDGYGSNTLSLCICGPQGDYTATIAGDCDDDDPTISPGGVEICDGRDNNCDGRTDEAGALGCLVYYRDEDGDTYGVTNDSLCLCSASSPYTATRGGDCNDSNAQVHPGAREICNIIDDNCDGITDPEDSPGCSIFFKDKDRDGWGVNGDSKCLCKATGDYRVTQIHDCDDNDPNIHPGATEICDGKDNNCDLIVDPEGSEGCFMYYQDTDRDGFGDPLTAKCLCGPEQSYTLTVGGDCCDQDSRVRPDQKLFFGTKSECGTWDYNCNGTATVEYDRQGGCKSWDVFRGCELETGWLSGVPACGITAPYVVGGCGKCCFLNTCCCSPKTENRTQRCN